MSVKTKQEKAFEKALLDFLADDANRALSVLAGHFVAVTLEMIRRQQGIEPSNSITITGGRREITIHAEEQSTENRDE